MTAVIETFRYGFMGSGTFGIGALAYSATAALIFVAIGTIIFNRVERSFMDTV